MACMHYEQHLPGRVRHHRSFRREQDRWSINDHYVAAEQCLKMVEKRQNPPRRKKIRCPFVTVARRKNVQPLVTRMDDRGCEVARRVFQNLDETRCFQKSERICDRVFDRIGVDEQHIVHAFGGDAER